MSTDSPVTWGLLALGVGLATLGRRVLELLW